MKRTYKGDTIYLFGGQGYVNLIDYMGDDLAIVNAARKSLDIEKDIFDKNDIKLLKYLWDNKHTSPFEMVEFKFAVKCPLFIARQWMRHRTWSYNEVSRRYTNENVEFFVPEILRKQSKDNKQASEGVHQDSIYWIDEMKDCNNTVIDLYNDLIGVGVCREQARGILPQNMMVDFYAKVDLHNLIGFLRLRDHPHAQWEMQEYARAIERLIAPIVPETMKLFRGEK